MRRPDRSGDDRKVLGENVDRPAIDLSISGDDAIGRPFALGHSEIRGRRFRQHEFFDECSRIQKLIETLSRGELPFRMLFGDRLLFTAQSFFPKRLKLFGDVASRLWHRRSLRLFAFGPLPSVFENRISFSEN